jgi:hypothetical protein
MINIFHWDIRSTGKIPTIAYLRLTSASLSWGCFTAFGRGEGGSRSWTLLTRATAAPASPSSSPPATAATTTAPPTTATPATSGTTTGTATTRAPSALEELYDFLDLPSVEVLGEFARLVVVLGGVAMSVAGLSYLKGRG